MKEYKLIKKYPGLPKDWEVGMIVGTGDRQGLACFSPCSGEYTDKHIDHNDVINNPEFWEEVKQISYEILSFTDGFNINNRYGKYFSINTQYYYSEKDLLKNPSWKIHSVRRLSDNEILTIGDKTNHGTIKEFEVCTDNRILLSFLERFCLSCYLDAKGSLPKKLKVLFTTEDSVDIFEGDKSFGVTTCWNIISYNGNKHGIKGDVFFDNKWFSTKEKAEEYILLNKPCLSINDVEFLKNECHVYWNEKLKQIVKSRL